jgi:hypothetical protein
VETDTEYNYSLKMLRKWLVSADKKHRENAITLDDFLTMRILPHKNRFLFPGRERRMTLDQKATSALGSINQTIKVMAGKKVTPNMSMRESLRTMDIQVEGPLSERHLRACREVRALSLYAISPTSDIVTKPCESQVGQQTKQSMSCGCRGENYHSILIKLLPEKEFQPKLPTDTKRRNGSVEVSLQDTLPGQR